MKKRIFILLLLYVTIGPVFGIVSYYGLNGMYFIPLARTASAGECEVALSSLPAPAGALNIYPFSLRGYVTFGKGLEIGVTNTYLYYMQYSQEFPLGFTIDEPEDPFVADTSNIGAPLIPSLKLAFLDEAVPNGSLAVGFEYPYGVFLLFDYNIVFSGGFELYGVVGLSTTTASLYGLGGLKLSLPIPLAVSLEGAYGGKTQILTQPQEAFVAVGLYYAITEQMTLDFVFRMDTDMVRRLSFGFNVKF